MYNTGLIKFQDIADEYGHLTAIEENKDIPFQIKRVYYITQVGKDVCRGFHSHRKLHQVLICINGEVTIKLKTPKQEEIVKLNRTDVGLYIGPMIWREMYNFSEESVLLVLASDKYDELDYIRGYKNYLDEAYRYFG